MENRTTIEKLLHDINSPLTSVGGYAELLKNLKNNDTITEKELKWINNLFEDTKKLKTMLLELQKLLK